MTGQFKINNPRLRILHAQLTEAAKPFTKATFAWFPRAKNSFADRLANEAMDDAESTTSSSDPPSTIAKTRAKRAAPAPQVPPAQNQEQPLPEVISIHNKRKKNMRTEYLASVIGTEEKTWILETKLLPKYRSMILDYEKAPNQPMPSQPPAPAPTLEVKQAPAVAIADPSSTSPAASLPAYITVTPQSEPLPKPSPSSLVPATVPERKLGELPPFAKMSTPGFRWGSKEAHELIRDVEQAYEVIIKWRKNVFKLPSGQCGKQFTQTLGLLLAAYGEKGPLECIAIKAAAILTPLLLQKPAGKPTYRDNVNHLSRRLQLWDAGNFKELLREGGTIQAQLESSHKAPDDTTLAKRFASMVFNNNLKGAMSLVTEKGKGGVLAIDESTKRDMKIKHPKAEQASADVLISGEMPESLHPVFYEKLNGELVKKCTLRTRGAAGVSQQEDALWHKMVTGYKDSSASLCNAVALLARRLATEHVDPSGLEALLANRGIAIDKCPGLRPVGVGEIARRIIGKAIMSVSGEKVQEAVGSLQLCGGQPAGIEAAIHAMRDFLASDENDGILLIDADNAFNRVNRAAALWNVQYICPALKHVLSNFYRAPTRIFMNGESFFELSSQEGTTQGCPLAMAMYALALAPLTKRLQSDCKQVWYADDVLAATS